ncbi:fam-l protein [Plasmodium brasilianum]|uniref:Fam-l protein n=1 Tax=Plasmodium brasilianum TaxID=5824 RepID=A0ACB9YF88_PLABR|nr:fam-l protein [Plasmodium brasilianum]
MEKRIKSTLLIKITTFILLSQERKDISNNEKVDSGKKKKLSGFPLKVAGGHKSDMKNKSCLFDTNKYSHMEKKIFKELDYIVFLKNNKTVSNKVYKKIICKKYELHIFLPVLIFFFLLILFIVEVSFGFAGKHSLLYQLSLNKDNLKSLTENDSWSPIVEAVKTLGAFLEHSISKKLGEDVCSWCENASDITNYCKLGHFFRILIYYLPFIILCITLISRIIYYHKKVKKYEKIKFRKR